ncbi:MAG: PEP-CTERM sorting domain-containing protein [Moorea sp. SIO4E2]|uniref:PEP-CTERM sorting domain-containing protein n=1 Tax=Moorena sp. SIO4E2 TaxID=2607826 RepID=UPI0013013BC5|nr:PEP-CTERM sorting domain-containing protein [Moorena sp. SIO4E2]NEQ11477.1 PEP-CTERM sorting domain-containing protein [Moorena sp. SIO4E2]
MPKARAITIHRHFIEPGTDWNTEDFNFSDVLSAQGSSGDALSITPNFRAGAAPENAVGGGNLVDIFNAAAEWWERAILDDFDLTLNFGWAPLGGGTLAVHSLVAQEGTPNRETEGTIRFDNDGSSLWFLDPTPDQNEEYQTFTETTTTQLGGGDINIGRVYTDPVGDAIGRFDLLSLAKHEIGHALGLSRANRSFRAENMDFDIDVQAPRPFPGTEIPTRNGAHLTLNTSLMFPFFVTGERKLQSGIDILANAEISEFNNINLNPVHVPEPTSTPLILSLAMGVGTFVKRKSLKRQSGL